MVNPYTTFLQFRNDQISPEQAREQFDEALSYPQCTYAIANYVEHRLCDFAWGKEKIEEHLTVSAQDGDEDNTTPTAAFSLYRIARNMAIDIVDVEWLKHILEICSTRSLGYPGNVACYLATMGVVSPIWIVDIVARMPARHLSPDNVLAMELGEYILQYATHRQDLRRVALELRQNYERLHSTVIEAYADRLRRRLG